MYINIIGLDGAGKDVQLNFLKTEFKEAEFVFEPGGTKESDIIRQVLLDTSLTDKERIDLIISVIQAKNIEPYTFDCLVDATNLLVSEGLTGKVEAYLYAAARCENIQKRIKPNLSQKDIIGSRSIACSMAYQGFARGLGSDTIWELNTPALDETYPDIEIFLDLPVEVAQSRLEKRTEKSDRLDGEDAKFFNLVRNGYIDYYKNHCLYNYVVINADDTIENINATILEIIKKTKSL